VLLEINVSVMVVVDSLTNKSVEVAVVEVVTLSVAVESKVVVAVKEVEVKVTSLEVIEDQVATVVL